MPTRADVDRQARALEALSGRAQRRAVTLWASLDPSDPAAAAEAFREAFPAVVDAFGEMAATLAADFYDETRAEAAPRTRFSAIPAEPPTAKAQGTAARLAGELFGEHPEDAVPGIRSATDRLVKEPYRATVSGSAAHDPAQPRWARVPRGSVTCDFCLMLASRGFVYRSEARAGAGHRYHGHCDCLPVASFDTEHPALQGYDPDALYRQWKTGERPTPPPQASATNQPASLDLPWDQHATAAGLRLEGHGAATRLEDTSPESALKANPGFATGIGDYRVNCQKCTLAYEMRRRGVDVTARRGRGPHVSALDLGNMTIQGNGNTQYFDGVTNTSVPLVGTGAARRAPLEAEILKAHPAGARGAVSVVWQNKQGHIFNWERTADGVRWMDSQIGQEYGADHPVWLAIHDQLPVVIARLDHLPLKDVSLQVAPAPSPRPSSGR